MTSRVPGRRRTAAGLVVGMMVMAMESSSAPAVMALVIPNPFRPRQHAKAIARRIDARAIHQLHSARTAGDENARHGDNGSTTTTTTCDPQRRRQAGMSLALTAVYFSVMAAKCALPATLSLLTNPTTGLSFGGAIGTGASSTSQQQVFAKILFTSTSAIAIGKLLLGPVIDRFGGVLSLKLSLLMLSALLGVISVSNSLSVFAVCWVLVDFIFSSCWAACINAIHQCFPDSSDWPNQIARLAAAARTGNAAAFAVFASLLSYASTRMTQAWRPIFAVSAVMQLVPVALLTVFGGATVRKGSSKQTTGLGSVEQTQALSRKSSTSASPINTLKREVRTLEFWCHLTSRSLLMVFASFLLFVPTLLNQVYAASSSAAARIGSLYAIGCLISVMAGSGRYAKLSRRNKILSTVGLLGLATMSSLAQLGHVMGTWSLSLTASAVSMFLWGLSFAIPFYIPPSLFALKRGGTESSATIADVFDIGGFALLACFNGYVAGLDHVRKAAWIPVFQMTTAAAAIALVALSVATWKEEE